MTNASSAELGRSHERIHEDLADGALTLHRLAEVTGDEAA